MQNKFQISNSESGVSLIITFFMMVIILAVVLSVSALLYSEIKIIKNIGDSVVAFYAADSGVEKILYYDRQEIPAGAIRGLCSMIRPIDIVSNPNPCIVDPSPNNANTNHSIYCNAIPPATAPSMSVVDPAKPEGCDVDKCDNCKVDFKTIMGNDKSYIASATITPDLAGGFSNFSINSTGSHKNTYRAVNLFTSKSAQQDPITVVYAYATPRSVPSGVAVDIRAEIRSLYGISQVSARIKTSSIATSWITLPLVCGSGVQNRICTGSQQDLSPVSYFVDIDIIDVNNTELIVANVPPYMQ